MGTVCSLSTRLKAKFLVLKENHDRIASRTSMRSGQHPGRLARATFNHARARGDALASALHRPAHMCRFKGR